MLHLITPRQARALRARQDRNAAWSAQFVKSNGWTVITAAEQKTCPRDARITNEERGRLEQFEIYRDKPAKLFAYVSFHEREIASVFKDEARRSRDVRPYDQACVSVWTGARLGAGQVNRVYRSNFGDRRASIQVTIAGETYSGTAYLDAGDYCRLQRVKG
jgi:hypothetical protein